MSQSPQAWSLKSASAPGIAAVKKNWAPFVAIQAVAVALVVLYYQNEALRQACETLVHWKLAGGFGFTILAGFIAGGVIPEIAKIATGQVKRFDSNWLRAAIFTGFVYAIIGIEVDLLYRAQSKVFGDSIDLGTLSIKTAVDMFLFSPFLSIPTAVSLFEWRRHRFKFKALASEWSWTFYKNKIIPALIPCWAFWIPILYCTYAMPPNLQFSFAMLAEAAWSILFVFVATRDH